jgi:hypothetical protein
MGNVLSKLSIEEIVDSSLQNEEGKDDRLSTLYIKNLHYENMYIFNAYTFLLIGLR